MPHLLKEIPYALVEEAACWSHTYHIRRFVGERNGQFGFYRRVRISWFMWPLLSLQVYFKCVLSWMLFGTLNVAEHGRPQEGGMRGQGSQHGCAAVWPTP